MQTIFGERKNGVNLVKKTGGRDEWKDSPLLSCGDKTTEEIGSEYITGWTKDQLVCGVFHGFTPAKYEDTPRGRKQIKRGVAYFKTLEGAPFRIYTTGSLEGTFKKTPENTYLEIVYLGKENREIDGDSVLMHTFDIFMESSPH